MNRRRFIGSAVLVALGSSAGPLLSGCTSQISSPQSESLDLSEHDLQTLFAVSRALFPHKSLSDKPYLAVVTTLNDEALKDQATRDLLSAAVEGLDAAAGGNWLSASATEKVAVLEAQQRHAYFGLVLNTTINTLYRDPQVWALLGYEGSSLEHGGYLTRGFDDISWLPKQVNQ